MARRVPMRPPAFARRAPCSMLLLPAGCVAAFAPSRVAHGRVDRRHAHDIAEEATGGFVKRVEHDDCYQAAKATVLDLPLSEVPHFYREAHYVAIVYLRQMSGDLRPDPRLGPNPWLCSSLPAGTAVAGLRAGQTYRLNPESALHPWREEHLRHQTCRRGVRRPDRSRADAGALGQTTGALWRQIRTAVSSSTCFVPFACCWTRRTRPRS